MEWELVIETLDRSDCYAPWRGYGMAQKDLLVATVLLGLTGGVYGHYDCTSLGLDALYRGVVG